MVLVLAAFDLSVDEIDGKMRGWHKVKQDKIYRTYPRLLAGKNTSRVQRLLCLQRASRDGTIGDISKDPRS